jgi:hypothetical protein
MTYQYVVVKMPGFTDEEQAWTARLNQVAAEGWRLVTISMKDYKGGSTAFATFEREVSV